MRHFESTSQGSCSQAAAVCALFRAIWDNCPLTEWAHLLSRQHKRKLKSISCFDCQVGEGVKVASIMSPGVSTEIHFCLSEMLTSLSAACVCWAPRSGSLGGLHVVGACCQPESVKGSLTWQQTRLTGVCQGLWEPGKWTLGGNRMAYLSMGSLVLIEGKKNHRRLSHWVNNAQLRLPTVEYFV